MMMAKAATVVTNISYETSFSAAWAAKLSMLATHFLQYCNKNVGNCQ